LVLAGADFWDRNHPGQEASSQSVAVARVLMILMWATTRW
jgi:hypothetical protein